MFIIKEFLLVDSGSKVELRELKNAQTYVDHLIGPEAIIRSDEETTDPFEAQLLCRAGRTLTVLEIYGFLISE